MAERILVKTSDGQELSVRVSGSGDPILVLHGWMMSGSVWNSMFLSLEAFDFGRERDLDPHLRLTGQWNFYRNLYVKAGYDDPLVDEFRSPFLGIGIHWSDDDLKYLMGSVPKL